MSGTGAIVTGRRTLSQPSGTVGFGVVLGRDHRLDGVGEHHAAGFEEAHLRVLADGGPVGASSVASSGTTSEISRAPSAPQSVMAWRPGCTSEPSRSRAMRSV